MKRRLSMALAGAMMAAALGACNGDDGLSAAQSMELVSGDEQVGTVGELVAQPLRVRVEAGNNVPVEGITVRWTVLTGGGAINPTSLTNADGVAVAAFTLGPAVGNQTAQAAVAGLDGSPVGFIATANAAPPPPGGGNPL
jgi:hypothetical protein